MFTCRKHCTNHCRFWCPKSSSFIQTEPRQCSFGFSATVILPSMHLIVWLAVKLFTIKWWVLDETAAHLVNTSHRLHRFVLSFLTPVPVETYTPLFSDAQLFPPLLQLLLVHSLCHWMRVKRWRALIPPWSYLEWSNFTTGTTCVLVFIHQELQRLFDSYHPEALTWIISSISSPLPPLNTWEHPSWGPVNQAVSALLILILHSLHL